MQVIYEPKGRAGEYSHLALNLFAGCQHRCSYCYVPASMRMSRQKWEGRGFTVREGVLSALLKDAPKYSGTMKRVLLSFTTDPYQPQPHSQIVTRDALTILHDCNVPFQVLTKGGTRAVADFDLYSDKDAFAVTLTDVSGAWSHLEHGTASSRDRMAALTEAHCRGIETWVSLEPVFDPRDSLDVIRRAWDVVDVFKIGKLNYDKQREDQIDWARFVHEAVGLCEKYEVRYYIKADLARYWSNRRYKLQNTDNRMADWRRHHRKYRRAVT